MTASDPSLLEPDLSGRTLDRYHLVRCIGVGGMGAVYEAEHTRLRKRFAVKLLRHDLARDETFRRRFLREARAASAISHPHVVAISDFGETEDDQVFFVMEMLAGRDLQQLLDAEGKLPWPRTREILGQVTSALQAAHAQDIIHRDMKPSNVFLADVAGKEHEDYVKVLDFGIAKLSGQMGEATIKLTSTDEIFGTVAYMAPEMATGVNDDRRSDVYAVGVMMYRMLTGALPFTQGTPFQILSQHIHAPLPPPRAKEPSIPEAVEAIILRALAKTPEERFSSMEEFGRALRRGTLEATEVLTTQPTQLLAGSPKLHEDTPATTLDKTTPLPASGLTPTPAPLATALAPPIVTSEAEVPAVPIAVATALAPPIVTSEAEVPAVPIAVAPTIVSTPIAVAPSDSSASAPMTAPGHASGPMLAPAPVQAAAPLDSGSTRLPAPARGSSGSLVARIVLLALGVATLAAVITRVVLRDSEPTDDAPPTQTAAAVEPKEGKPSPQPVASIKQPAPTKPEPTPAPADPVDAPTPTQEQPAGTTPEPSEPEPTDEPPAAKLEPKPPTPSKPKAKPKTDAEVVAALKAKLASKCKDSGTTKVKVEGMITSTGSTTGLLITPQTGPGACASGIVSKAKFDPAPGSRPIPRFSVEL